MMVYSDPSWDVVVEERDLLRDALKEIAEIAEVSEGVEFYAMLARKALDRADELRKVAGEGS